MHDKPLPNDEPRLRAVFDQLAEHGELLIVVDQPDTIGALPVSVTRSCGHIMAYLPGLTMRRAADLYAGTAKTDARDEFVIAETWAAPWRTPCAGWTGALTRSPNSK